MNFNSDLFMNSAKSIADIIDKNETAYVYYNPTTEHINAYSDIHDDDTMIFVGSYNNKHFSAYDLRKKCYAALAKHNHRFAELKGTPKQIAWAEDIRAEIMHDLEYSVWQYEDDPELYNDEAEIYEQAKKAINVLNHFDSAAWWINKKQRGYDANRFRKLGAGLTIGKKHLYRDDYDDDELVSKILSSMSEKEE